MGNWSPPQSFDGYLLFRLLGRGGMGEVHLASDSLLDRQVAIKFISATGHFAPGHQAGQCDSEQAN